MKSGFKTIGLMSGTSMDGVDAAIIETDGYTVFSQGGTAFIPFSPGFRESFRALEQPDPMNHAHAAHLIGELTAVHADAVDAVLSDSNLKREDIDVIGFHGQTVYHAPHDGITIQLGDGQNLANRTGIPVVCDFRGADVKGGGQGAPLAPLYHQALAVSLEKPLAVLNVGGVANVTWLGNDDAVVAFDTGPGNALIDDWVHQHTGNQCDKGGRLAQAGHVNQQALSGLLDHGYFDQPPPKSLDRRDFDLLPAQSLSLEIGAATLSSFTVEAVVRSQEHMPERPVRWLVCGGGRHNPALMDGLRNALAAAVKPVETVGWDGDFLEAQAFAFLAVRSLLKLPLSLPTTTGVKDPQCGGELYKPE